ncbi:MAG: 50S ribosomal protein L4 [Actinomycetota bacterium]|nr:50S ribosomal protein L4 [Actinomycetota bacterium]
MLKLPVHDRDGKIVGEVELDPNIFDSKIVESLVHQAVKLHLAKARGGNASTKTRSEVRGGGVKPWRQKGTGRARAGSIRSPLWKGGGSVFGPSPRDFSFDMPKKARRLALKSVLSMKAKDAKIMVVKDFAMTEPKTKEVVSILSKLGAPKKVTVVVAADDVNTQKSMRNIPSVKSIEAAQLNVYDALNNEALLLTEAALGKITEVLG